MITLIPKYVLRLLIIPIQEFCMALSVFGTLDLKKSGLIWGSTSTWILFSENVLGDRPAFWILFPVLVSKGQFVDPLSDYYEGEPPNDVVFLMPFTYLMILNFSGKIFYRFPQLRTLSNLRSYLWRILQISISVQAFEYAKNENEWKLFDESKVK